MITREELFYKIQREIAIEYCFNDLVEIIESGAVKSVFDKTYDSLEAQLNTEQLTCDDCQYQTAGDEWRSGCSHNDIYDYYDDGSYTIPTNFYCNRFKPKDTK